MAWKGCIRNFQSELPLYWNPIPPMNETLGQVHFTLDALQQHVYTHAHTHTQLKQVILVGIPSFSDMMSSSSTLDGDMCLFC